MKSISTVTCAAVVLLAAVSADALEPDTLRLHQSSQQRAQQMARELVTEILTVQLQQLSFNGLTDLPIYQDIALMRRNVDQLVKTEMTAVVELLATAQQTRDAAKQQDIFKQARQKVREIVKRLSAERQKLLRRMRVSKVTGLAEHILGLQRQTLQQTESLPKISDPEDRETRALSAIQDQQDVSTLYFQLVAELSGMSGWGGQAGPTASDGLRMLRAHKVDDHVVAAAKKLEAVQYVAAAAEQKAVVEGLTAMLYQVGRTSGRTRSSFSQLLKMIVAIQKRQRAVHDQTVKFQKDVKTAISLAGGQRDVHRDLGVLADHLAFLPQTKPNLDTAKSSALQAVSSLVGKRPQAALAPQKAVLTSLERIVVQLRAAEQAANPQRTAEDLANEVKVLRQLDTAMARIRATHKQVEAQVASAPAAAAALEKRVADDVAAEQSKHKILPDAVSARLEQAHLVAADAAKRIPTGPGEARQAVQATDEALAHAHAEVKRALADARRAALGMKIGELARAIDALERASVAERAQAVRARVAANEGGFKDEAAKKFVDQQQTVAEVTKDVAEAVKQTAPSVLPTLAEAEKTVLTAKQHILDGKGVTAAEKASADAEKASVMLADATKLIRQEIAKTADELFDEATKELATVNAVGAKVDAALTDPTERSAAEDLAELEAAELQVLNAQAQQLRAAGQVQAAQAVDMVNQVNRATDQQATAAAAIDRFKRGEDNTPLDAVNELQKLADQAERMAGEAAKRPQKTPDPMSQAIRETKQAADAAVQAMLEGNAANAKIASQAAQQALAKVEKQAKAEAAKVRLDHTKPLDADAQQKVTDAAGAAAGLSKKGAPGAAGELKKASMASGKAAADIRAKKAPEAKKKQAAVAGMLKTAEKKIAAAKKALAQKAKQELAAKAAKAGQLAEETRDLDPTASAALKRAQQTAKAGGDGQLPKKAADVEKNLQQAAANIEARRQGLERDKALAKSLKDLAKKQQQARDDLVAMAAQLTNPPKAGPLKPNKPGVDNSSDQGDKASGKNPKAPSAPSPADTQAQTEPNPGGDPGKSPKLQKNGSPPAPSPGGQSGQAPPGNQQAQPEQPDMPFTGKDKLDDAKKLTTALGDYMGAQENLGEMAEKLTKQKKVANKPLREALKKAAKLDPNLERAPREDFIPPEETPIFPPSSAPPLPPQIAGSGAMPEQAKKEKSDVGGATKIPPQEQGPQSPASTAGQAKETNNPQVQNPPEEGVNASTIVQTAPITSAPQPGAPPSAPGVFQPNTGKPKSATPTSNSSPPPAGKPPKQNATKEDLAKAIEKQKERDKKKRMRNKPPVSDQPAQVPPLGDNFTPEDVEETAQQIAGEEAIKKARKKLKDEDQLTKEDEEVLGEEEQAADMGEQMAAAPPPKKKADEPKEDPAETGTTPGDLGMGQGTPGKGVGGESTGNQTEDRPQKGNQHGRFDGKRDAEAPPDLKPKGLPFPPGFKPKGKDKPPEEDPFALPEEKDKPNVLPDADPNAPQKFGGGKGGGLRPGTRTADAKVARKNYSREAWFAKLPPELRTAIQSSSKIDPPRGYEQKLRRYRQSIK